MRVLLYRWRWGGGTSGLSPLAEHTRPAAPAQPATELYFSPLSSPSFIGKFCPTKTLSWSSFHLVKVSQLFQWVSVGSKLSEEMEIWHKNFWKKLFSEKCLVFTNSQPITMDVVNTLPSELLYKIISYLDRESLFISSQVCLRYKVVTMSNILLS